jgi:hypothetical protein
VTNNTKDVDAIRHQMARIRRRRHVQVRGLLSNAERVVHLGRQLEPYAWSALGAGAATALWLVTGRAAKARAGRVANGGVVNVPQRFANDPPGRSERPKLQQRAGDAWSMIVSAVIRAAQNYAAQRLASWIASKRRAVAGGRARSFSDDALEKPKDCVERPERELTDVRPLATNGEAWIP